MMMSAKESPREGYSQPPAVLLTLFSRSEYLREQMECLVESKVVKLYVSIDGPRNEEDILAQANILDILKSYRKRFEIIKISRNAKNLGIAVAMVQAIDWFFSENENGLVFEDDVFFQKSSLGFLQRAILEIQNRDNVLLASACQPFQFQTNRIVASNYPMIWGWGTWSFKWREMRTYLIQKPAWDAKTSRRVRQFWNLGFERVRKGLVDTWDIPIAAGMRSKGKLCLMPPKNLSRNVGFGPKSSNTLEDRFPLNLPITSEANFDWPYSGEPICSSEVISQLNERMEVELFKIKRRHAYTNWISRFDAFRFKQNKGTLKSRLLLASTSKTETIT